MTTSPSLPSQPIPAIASQSSSPAVPEVLQPQTPPPASPASVVTFSPHPEQEPISMHVEQAPAYIESSHPLPELASEVVASGVSGVAEQPELTTEDQEAGIEPAKESVPVSTEPIGVVTLPMKAERATELLKTDNNPADARVWAANVILYELHKKQLQEELKLKGEPFIQ